MIELLKSMIYLPRNKKANSDIQMRKSSLDKIKWLKPYKVKRHNFAKSVSLKIAENGLLEIIIPRRFALNHLPLLLQENRQWIEEVRSALPELPDAVLPERIHLKAFHQTWKVDYCKTNQKLVLLERFHQKEIVLLGNTDHTAACAKLLKQWIIKKAKEHLVDEIEVISKKTGLSFKKVSVRTQKTMWGSCNSHHHISLNWKLVLLPARLMEYVIIHELCHTVYLDHSKKFWELLESHFPGTDKIKDELVIANNYLPSWL